VIVGRNADLLRARLSVKDANWISIPPIAAPLRAQAPRSSSFLADHYDVTATLDPITQSLSAVAKVEFKAQEVSSAVRVELHSNLNVTEVRSAEVEDFVTSGRSLAGQQIHLVIAIKVIFVFPASQRHPFQELIGDLGIAGSGRQSGEPVEAREDAILDGTGFNVSWPTDNRRHAEPAFEAP